MPQGLTIDVDVSRPHAAISTTLDGDVLVVLAGTTKRLTGREITRLLKRRVSHTGVQKALQRLTEQGIVSIEQAGAAQLYWLNRSHLAAPLAVQMAALRTSLIEKLTDALGSWSIQPVAAALFGSTARADGDTESDVDIFVVRPSDIPEDDRLWQTQLNEFVAEIYEWTGNHASIAEVSNDEIERLRTGRPEIVDDLIAHGITLAGPHVGLIFGSRG